MLRVQELSYLRSDKQETTTHIREAKPLSRSIVIRGGK